MVNKGTNKYYLVLIFFNIKLLGAEKVSNTTSNEGSTPSSVAPRISDLGAMGFPNFGSGRFGNPTSNYPMNSFFPFGNQNNDEQQPQSGGLNYNPNQGNYGQDYPNHRYYPYQGNMNYQQPQYGNQEFPKRPVERYPNQDGYPYQYPTYHRPHYYNRPNDGSLYPGNLNRPYQNGGIPSNEDRYFNRPIHGHAGDMTHLFRYPPHRDQYPQGNFPQDIVNLNIRRHQKNTIYLPDDLSKILNKNIHFPDEQYQNQPNQYYPQPSEPHQSLGLGLAQTNNFQPYPLNNNNFISNVEYPINNPVGANDNPAAIQLPNKSITKPGAGLYQGIFNNIPQNQAQVHNSSNYNNTVGISGKPVTGQTTSSPVTSTISTGDVNVKKCIQDCPTTSEYAPVCGTNNVTYSNPGEFDCAQRCGVVVYLRWQGRCPGDIVPIEDNDQ